MMKVNAGKRGLLIRAIARSMALTLVLLVVPQLGAQTAGEPTPLLKQGQAVDWWFVFKFNAGSLPGCASDAQRVCRFGGSVQPYKSFSQQFAFASSADHTLQAGGGCVGDTNLDPLGATFDELYNGKLFYVVWNDQFYGDPIANKGGPAGHSKGAVAWDKSGNGFVLQVSTPSWPGSGSSNHPRATDGNTLGCVKDPDVLVSQHFFALKLNKNDVVSVLDALENASVVTDPSNPQVVNNGGPEEIQTLVKNLGRNSKSKIVTKHLLSSGVVLISKPSDLHVPPWQMVSAVLGGEPLRTATWWANPYIPPTTSTSDVGCWDPSLAKPGAVDIAITGTWEGNTIGLKGTPTNSGNHAKIGISTGRHTYSIFGDMNQQGSLSGPNCKSSQNGRGGLFYVIDDPKLTDSLRELLKGQSAPSD